MVEMKSAKVVLSLAAQLASWRAVLVLLRTRATCKPWQRKDFDQYSISLADCLNQSKQTVSESTGGGAATESRKVGEGPRKRWYAYVDRPDAKPEPELGPRGPTLKKQVLKGSDWLDVRPGLQPADSDDTTQDFEREKRARARVKDSSSEDPSLESRRAPFGWDKISVDRVGALERKWSPRSPYRGRADAPPRPPSPAPVPGWRRFFCLGNGK